MALSDDKALTEQQGCQPDVRIEDWSTAETVRFTAVTEEGGEFLTWLMEKLNAEGQSTGWNGVSGCVEEGDADYVYQTCLIASLAVQLPDGSCMYASPQQVKAFISLIPAEFRFWLNCSDDVPQ